MARMNYDIAIWAIGLLDVQSSESVLEIGFGPGIAIERLADCAFGSKVSGIDSSAEMVEQAANRLRPSSRAASICEAAALNICRSMIKPSTKSLDRKSVV